MYVVSTFDVTDIMKRLYNAAASVRSTLFCQTRNRTVSAARQLDPILRSALATTVREDLVHDRTDVLLAEVEAELAEAVQNLAKAVEREQFLGVRSRQYRKALDARARVLRDEGEMLQQQRKNPQSRNNVADEEDDAAENQRLLLSDWEMRMEQWEKDEDALQSIRGTHQQILASCEQIRRTIADLDVKKKALHRLNDECHDFLAVADSAENDESQVNTAVAEMELVAATASMEEGTGTVENDIVEAPPSLTKQVDVCSPERAQRQ